MSGPDELACREFVELVTDYLEGAVPPAEKRRLEVHLAECPGCAAYLEQMRVTVELTGSLDPDAELPPPAVREALLTVFRAWRQGTVPPAGGT